MKDRQPQLPCPQEFPTRDIYLASVLRMEGIPILRVDNNVGRGVFVFQASKAIQSLISEYFNGTLRLDPKGLFETWKALKSMAFSATGDVR
jgi:hypothetical protein